MILFCQECCFFSKYDWNVVVALNNMLDWNAVIALFTAIAAMVAAIAFILNVFTERKENKIRKYELTSNYIAQVHAWHDMVVLLLLKLYYLPEDASEERRRLLTELSSAIESGRFYFPNVKERDKNSGRSYAYQGERSLILDFLVYSFQLYSLVDKKSAQPAERDAAAQAVDTTDLNTIKLTVNSDYENIRKHTKALRKLFTSRVMEYLDPHTHIKESYKRTNLVADKEYSVGVRAVDDILATEADELRGLFS